MNVISRCIQDIVKYWSQCWWICGIVVGVVCSISFSVRFYQMKSGVIPKSWFYFMYRLLIYVCDSVYLTYVFYVTFGMRYIGERREIQWVPFKTVWSNPWEIPLLVENILLFVPFGILVTLSCRQLIHWKVVAKYSIMVSLLIEVSQYIFRCGKTEVDDVILNCLGAMIGYGLFVFGSRIRGVSK